MSHTPHACTILRQTHDGHDLAPIDLALLQDAVNNQLTPAGEQAFAQLYHQVIQGTYQAPWFHDQLHLTIDQQGYVRWRGQIVEHYTLSWAYSEPARIAAIELARRCRALEAQDIVPTMTTAIWKWTEPTSTSPTAV